MTVVSVGSFIFSSSSFFFFPKPSTMPKVYTKI